MTPKWDALATRADAAIRGVLSGKAGHRVFVAALLAATVVLRVVLVERGGQPFFFDETKLSPATESARLLSTGDIRGALVYAIEPHPGVLGDHFGFKVAGILPELVENRTGHNDHIPALYFSLFSALNVLLLAAIAFRLSASRRAFDITLVAAAASAVLLIYARFLLPYDLSLCVALLAVWLGVRRPAGFGRSGVVGALAAWTFFCYFGYWPLAGTVVLVHALWSIEDGDRIRAQARRGGTGKRGRRPGPSRHQPSRPRDPPEGHRRGCRAFRPGARRISARAGTAGPTFSMRNGAALFLWVAAFARGPLD